MSVYNIHGTVASPYDINGNPCSVYDIYGNLIGDYNVAASDYEKAILRTRDSWIAEARADATILPVIIHTDQHGRMTATNSLFSYLGKAIPWNDASACIGLGDTDNYWVGGFQNMVSCLSGIPKNKQINIWGNHDTWTSDWLNNRIPPTVEEWGVLNQYFDNSSYNGNHRYNTHGIEYMIDDQRKIKYVTFGGWEYDPDLGGYSHYNIGSDSMDHIIQMLSAQDDYDIVILIHVQPFAGQNASDWMLPPPP